MATQSVRRRVTRPRRLVTMALEKFTQERHQQVFARSMARMAADPAIRKQCAAIQKDFARAEADSLHRD